MTMNVFASDQLAIFQSGDGDVTITASDGACIKAHSYVLRLSPVLHAQLTNPMLEAQTSCIQFDCDEDTAKAFLKFLYAGALVTDGIKSLQLIMDLVRLSDYYGIIEQFASAFTVKEVKSKYDALLASYLANLKGQGEQHVELVNAFIPLFSRNKMYAEEMFQEVIRNAASVQVVIEVIKCADCNQLIMHLATAMMTANVNKKYVNMIATHVGNAKNKFDLCVQLLSDFAPLIFVKRDFSMPVVQAMDCSLGTNLFTVICHCIAHGLQDILAKHLKSKKLAVPRGAVSLWLEKEVNHQTVHNVHVKYPNKLDLPHAGLVWLCHILANEDLLVYTYYDRDDPINVVTDGVVKTTTVIAIDKKWIGMDWQKRIKVASTSGWLDWDRAFMDARLEVFSTLPKLMTVVHNAMQPEKEAAS